MVSELLKIKLKVDVFLCAAEISWATFEGWRVLRLVIVGIHLLKRELRVAKFVDASGC